MCHIVCVFAGGDQSIRGYAHDSLSPISDKGYLTGGQVLAVGTAEYNYEFMKDLRLAVLVILVMLMIKALLMIPKLVQVSVFAGHHLSVKFVLMWQLVSKKRAIPLSCIFYWHTILIQLSLLFYLFYDFISPTDWRELIILTICD